MRRAAMIALVVCAWPAFAVAELPDTVGPWVPETQVSIGWSGPQPLSDFGDLSVRTVPGLRNGSVSEPINIGFSAQLEDDMPIEECRGHCPVPPVSSLTADDWQTIYRVYIGVQVENADQWSWPGSPDSKYTHILRHLQRWYQIVGHRLLQDVGYDVRIISRCRYVREHPGPVTVADLDGECALCGAPLGAVTVYRISDAPRSVARLDT